MKTVLFYIWLYAITFICLFLGMQNYRLAYRLAGANEKFDKLEQKMGESYEQLCKTTKDELREVLRDDIYTKIREQIESGMVCPVIVRTEPDTMVVE